MESKWGQGGAKTAKNSKKNIDPTKTTLGFMRVAVFWSKKWPTWLQLGPQNGAKINKKSKPKSIKILVPLGVGFWSVFGGFWEANGAKLAPKTHQKSISTSEGPFYKKYYKANGISMIF